MIAILVTPSIVPDCHPGSRVGPAERRRDESDIAQGRPGGWVVWPIVPLYAAYGSNMDPAQMRTRCPHSPAAGTGWVVGWRLTFGGEELGWEGALATLVEEPGEQVFVALYDITPADQVALDKWESADSGLYRTCRLRVSTLEADVVAWTYVLNAYEGGLPSARYLGLMAEGADAAGAPTDYVAELRSRPCRSIGL
jgi:hypothetical protein